MNWCRMALKTPVLMKVQVPLREQLPGQLTGLVTALANRMEISTSGWLACYTSATLRATAVTLDLHSL